MRAVGYAFLHESLQLKAFPPKHPALIKPVTRVTVMDDYIGVPQTVAPVNGLYLEHILFALKHEGVNLAILAQALPRIHAGELLAELNRTPNGLYIRKACFLWESFTRQKLEYTTAVRGAVVPLFDPKRYVTGPAVRNTRWRQIYVVS